MDERANSLFEDEKPEESQPEESSRSSRCCSEHSEGVDAWLMLLRVFLYHALFGFNYGIFGILYVEYVDYFDSTKADVGWIVSIQIFLYSMLAFTSMTFRLLVTIIANLRGVNRVAIFSFGMLLGAVAVTVLLTAGVELYWGIVAGAAITGLHMACTNTVVTVVMVDLVGVECIGRSIALHNFTDSFPFLFATPFCGFLFDVSGSYLLPFICVGAASMLGSVFSVASNITHKRITRNQPIKELEI
ncbi:hypothetical protein CAPTEDRAFT_202863 [Capitella teleta]|uniref:Major facilitator superfamily (MFS) profile domain-containing protein n=1 Tax=Capitella teleta TaxID=283909 RepID=R7UHS4_CAPTE|nr:hypothetical protein CAPTEDRAFT_202863 [Capitella teleta]|eukprot:ELU06079.1 hypothetical protein CAPTEDRAFT_202863 [Capitella teleta]